MSWQTVVQASVQLCGGIWCLLFGFGYVRAAKLGAADTLQRRFWWRVAGMALILLACMQVVDATIQSRHLRNRNADSTSTAEKRVDAQNGTNATSVSPTNTNKQDAVP